MDKDAMDYLVPLADALQMYLYYENPGVRNVQGQCRFAIKADPKLKFTMEVNESFVDTQHKTVVLLVRVAKKLYLLASYNPKQDEMVIRIVNTDRLGIAVGQKKLFSMFSDFTKVVDSWDKGILATFQLNESGTWSRIK